jgi:hypothetical protein
MPAPRKTDKEYLDDALEIIRKQNVDLADLRRNTAQLRKKLDAEDNIREVIFQIASHDPAPPKWLTKLPVGSKVRGTPVGVWSDIHYGEVSVTNKQNGIMAYNAAIAQKRIKLLVDRTIDLSFNHMGDSHKEYPGIIICLGGDMIGGDIHEELMMTNDRTPLEAVNDLTDLLAAAIGELAEVFSYVYLPAVVGNHGRSSKKPPNKFIARNNYDYSIYLNLIRHFKNDPRVQFTASKGPDCHFKSYHHRFCLTHGDRLGTAGGDGIIGAMGPILRGAVKIGRQKAIIDQPFDTLIVCHYHEYMPLPRVVVNGAVKGPDEFSVNKLRIPPSVPTQALMLVHPKYGIVDHRGIFLEEPKTIKRSAAPWVSWQNE